MSITPQSYPIKWFLVVFFFFFNLTESGRSVTNFTIREEKSVLLKGKTKLISSIQGDIHNM